MSTPANEQANIDSGKSGGRLRDWTEEQFEDAYQCDRFTARFYRTVYATPLIT